MCKTSPMSDPEPAVAPPAVKLEEFVTGASVTPTASATAPAVAASEPPPAAPVPPVAPGTASFTSPPTPSDSGSSEDESAPPTPAGGGSASAGGGGAGGPGLSSLPDKEDDGKIAASATSSFTHAPEAGDDEPLLPGWAEFVDITSERPMWCVCRGSG